MGKPKAMNTTEKQQQVKAKLKEQLTQGDLTKIHKRLPYMTYQTLHNNLNPNMPFYRQDVIDEVVKYINERDNKLNKILDNENIPHSAD